MLPRAFNPLCIVGVVAAPLNRSPLDPGVSQYDWGGDLDDASETYDPLSSMMGDLDQDMQAAKGAQSAGLGVYVGPRRVLGPGGLFGEISFFTEIPQMETVRCARTAWLVSAEPASGMICVCKDMHVGVQNCE